MGMNWGRMMKWDWHTKVSFFKSITRILGFMLFPVSLTLSAVILIIAEGLGLAEEL